VIERSLAGVDLAGVATAVRDREPDMLALLERLVALESPSEDKALADRVASELASEAERIGLRVDRLPVERFGETVVARLVPTMAPAMRVLLVGHYDTVYAAGTLAMCPFRIESDRAHGPGVFDMKAGLVIGLTALEAVIATGDTESLAVTFVMNGDEEPGSPRSRDVIVAEAHAHDLALILEPGRPGPAVTVARKGVGIFTIDVQGVEAHAGADPHLGANSIVELAGMTTALYELNDRDRGTSVTPGVVHGGTQPYVVPGQASLTFDVRVETLEEQERLLGEFDRIVHSTRIDGTRARLTGSFHRPPLVPTPASERYVELLREVAERVGYPLGTGTSGGASDGNLTAAAGVPTIDGMGPHGGRAHSPEEYLEVSSLSGKAGVLAAFLLALAAGQQAPTA
jgi:glutamate carboxypeptidase